VPRKLAPTPWELLILFVGLGVLATIFLPRLFRTPVSQNEQAALEAIDAIVQAQVAFANERAVDRDLDDVGEYAAFGELTGLVPPRGSDQPRAPALGPSYRLLNGYGDLLRSGYLFRLYLPDAAATGLPGLPTGEASPDVEPARASSRWSLYAWPQQVDTTGARTFFVDQTGRVLQCRSALYSGESAPITAGAALAPGRRVDSMEGEPAAGILGRDGNVWEPVTR
jgi:type II secretory pathway pseudopilin PulG